MKPEKIIIHHSLTKDSETVSWGAIRKYHVETLGFSDIGYHAGCENVGYGYSNHHYEVLYGRSWYLTGAHTIGQNDKSLGFCFVGNYDEEEPPRDMLVSGAKLIYLWMTLYNIPIEEIYGHSHFADYKSCPGTKFDIEVLKSIIEGIWL